MVAVADRGGGAKGSNVPGSKSREWKCADFFSPHGIPAYPLAKQPNRASSHSGLFSFKEWRGRAVIYFPSPL